ncbi:hypothetical protein SAVIM40S_04084 [Streptomyces avidinii]
MALKKVGSLVVTVSHEASGAELSRTGAASVDPSIEFAVIEPLVTNTRSSGARS